MSKRNHNKNPILEQCKKAIAKQNGCKNWNEVRLKFDLKDSFRLLNEAAEMAIINTINIYEKKLLHAKQIRKVINKNNLQSELKKYFPE